MSAPGEIAMLAQIAAHLLGIPLHKVRLYTRATDRTEGMGPAASSRMTFMAGNSIMGAAELARTLDQGRPLKDIAGLAWRAGACSIMIYSAIRF